MADDFGLTNDEQEINEVAAFRDAAIADGWDAKPGGSSEPLEVYAHLEKEGFKMHAMCRRNAGKWKFQTNIHIWGRVHRATVTDPANYLAPSSIKRRWAKRSMYQAWHR